MVTVAEAEKIIELQARDYGNELVPFEQSLGRVLAEDLFADRDLPPCNRVTMDGIAIRFNSFKRGILVYKVKAIIAAGDVPTDITDEDECVEIMTGAALPDSADTVIRYEDIEIVNGIVTVNASDIRKGQNLHLKGRDKKQGDIVAKAGQVIGPALISMAASVGKIELLIKKLPRVVIITTGDELVDVRDQPTTHQVRRSNSYTIKAVLAQDALQADMLHIPDDLEITRKIIKESLKYYDVLLMSGGVSMGKFDYVPRVLEDLGISKLFHKVQQRPGKPFWFGKDERGVLVFAFPGNPVSTFLCLHRYFLPWFKQIPNSKFQIPNLYAVLDSDVTFNAPMQYFMQVRVDVNELGQLIATPDEGNGSGDFANLLDSDAFMELPIGKVNFKKGEVYRIWPFKKIG